MIETCQKQTEFDILSAAAFAALESVTKRQYALLTRLADAAPAVLLAAMNEIDRAVMVELVRRATQADVQSQAKAKKE